jgi:acetamidase/formamidase
MPTYSLDSAARTVTDVFSSAATPVLTVRPGDHVVVHSLDASGHVERQRHPGEETRTLIADARGHCLVGPIAVEGAAPGQMLAVHLVSVRPDSWGYTGAGVSDTPLNRRLGLTAGEHSTIPPRSHGGGNIDCRELVAGSTLYLPVTAPGALLSVGDGHAAQGDGEVSGTAIECGMTTELRLDLVSCAPLDSIHAVTPAGRITFGFDADLNEATAVALAAMVTWMGSLFGIGRAEALAIASVAVSLRVTQVANQTWGVHALLPDGAVTTSTRP